MDPGQSWPGSSHLTKTLFDRIGGELFNQHVHKGMRYTPAQTATRMDGASSAESPTTSPTAAAKAQH